MEEASSQKATKGGNQWQSTASSSYFSAITDLPSHILMEILFKLPIKTLVASKCVCKSWLHLITDPNFPKLHQTRANIEVCFQSHASSRVKQVNLNLYMVNFCFRNDSHCLDMKLNTLFGLPKFKIEPNNVHKSDSVWGNFTFVNSCNGLLCYYCTPNSFAVIWNPITFEFITVPAPNINNGLSKCCAFGLGFSQKANRFKLLCITVRKEKGSSEPVAVAEICTIEKGCSWRTVGSCPCSIFWSFYLFSFGTPRGSFLQSALHWFVAGSHKTDMVIVSFDFEDEKFGEVPLPPHFKTKDFVHPNTSLGVLAGCLFITDRTEYSHNIWLMKEYGVRDSWTRVFSLYHTLAEGNKYACYIPIKYLDYGEILMMRYDNPNSYADLFVYNQGLKSVAIIGSGCFHTVVAFSPSLVPLKDSMMGYDVHVKSRCADMKHRKTSPPSWWKPLIQISKDKIPRMIGAPTVGSSYKGHLNECHGENSSPKSKR